MLVKFCGSQFPVGKTAGYELCIRFRRPPQLLLDIGLGADTINDGVVAFVVMQPRPFVEPCMRVEMNDSRPHITQTFFSETKSY